MLEWRAILGPGYRLLSSVGDPWISGAGGMIISRDIPRLCGVQVQKVVYCGCRRGMDCLMVLFLSL